MAAQKRQEAKLTQRMLEKCQGPCMNCGNWPDFRGLSKHEKVFRSQGGDLLDPENCELLCGDCHTKKQQRI